MIRCEEPQPIKCKTDEDCAKYKIPNFKCIEDYCIIKKEEKETLQPVTCQTDQDCINYNVPNCDKCVNQICHCNLSEANSELRD